MIDINSFFFNDSTKKLLLKWIKDDYKNIPLCIYGGNGLGKTSLANYLVNTFSVIKIDIEFIRSNRDLKVI